MQREDIERAAETLAAMAEIPCLRGGYAPFDYTDDLAPCGWGEDDCGTMEYIYAEVPSSPSSRAPSLTKCRSIIHAAIDERHAEFERALVDESAAQNPRMERIRLEGRSQWRRLLEQLDPDHVEDPMSEVTAWLRADRVLVDLGYSHRGRDEAQRQLAANPHMVDWLRLLTDDEFRRYVELADDDPPEPEEVVLA
jgi:hypothetical protein